MLYLCMIPLPRSCRRFHWRWCHDRGLERVPRCHVTSIARGGGLIPQQLSFSTISSIKSPHKLPSIILSNSSRSSSLKKSEQAGTSVLDGSVLVLAISTFSSNLIDSWKQSIIYTHQLLPCDFVHVT